MFCIIGVVIKNLVLTLVGTIADIVQLWLLEKSGGEQCLQPTSVHSEYILENISISVSDGKADVVDVVYVSM